MKNERGEQTGGQSDETPGSRRFTTPMTVISDEEEESQIKGMEIDQPSRSRGGERIRHPLLSLQLLILFHTIR
jgi:hypothetical protein